VTDGEALLEFLKHSTHERLIAELLAKRGDAFVRHLGLASVAGCVNNKRHLLASNRTWWQR
jgi:hypothetical protein